MDKEKIKVIVSDFLDIIDNKPDEILSRTTAGGVKFSYIQLYYNGVHISFRIAGDEE